MERIAPPPITTEHEMALIQAARSDAASRRGRPPTLTDSLPSPTADLPGYRMVGPLHRGGQGVVYEAVQLSTGRRVAIKVLRHGPLADANERTRFLREVRLLGQLTHPGIVPIHDSGISDTGHFYYVMDHIEGLRLDDLIRAERLPIRDTLALAADICNAVQAAHIRGVIHRDLKPANILVESSAAPSPATRGGGGGGQVRAQPEPGGGSPRLTPRILDFGLAKLILPDDPTQDDPVTQTGEFLGSLPWASPEQADGRWDQVDLRTDVYALGVILYQLLTGQLPFDVTGSRSLALKAITETEPAAPSRASPPTADSPRIDRDTDAIVLKCLSKDPAGRYQSAGDLERDLRRRLAGLPVEARRPSPGYLARRWIARNRIRVALFAALALAAGATIALAIITDRQQADRLASLQAQRTATVFHKILEDIFLSGDPQQGAIRDTTLLRTQLDDAVARIDAELADFPDIRARLLTISGETFRGLGLYDRADQVFASARAIAEASPAADRDLLPRIIYDQATIAQYRYEPARAAPLFEQALHMRRPIRADDTLAAGIMHSYASTLASLGRRQQAQALAAQSFDIFNRTDGPNGRHTLLAASTLAETTPTADWRTSVAHRRQHLALLRASLPPGHTDIARWLDDLAELLRFHAQLDDAEAASREAVDILAAFKPPTPQYAGAIYTLALILNDRGHPDQALPLYQQALDIDRAALGENAQFVAVIKDQIGVVLFGLNRHDEAEAIIREALATFRADPPVDPRPMAYALEHLARILWQRQALDEAESLALEALALRRADPNTESQSLGDPLIVLGRIRMSRNDPTGAEQVFREAASIRRRAYGQPNQYTANVESLLGWSLTALDRLDEAKPILQEAHATLVATLGPDHAWTKAAAERLKDCQVRQTPPP